MSLANRRRRTTGFIGAAIMIGAIGWLPLGDPPAFALDRQTIIQQIINQSLASYPGNCPCPYNTDRAGHSCGRRSAYTRPGGYSPICFASDVTEEMIQNWMRTH